MMRNMQQHAILKLVLVIIYFSIFVYADSVASTNVLHGHRIANNEQLTQLQQKSQFANRKSVSLGEVKFGKDSRGILKQDDEDTRKRGCKHSDLDMRWQRQAGASIYQTPVIFDLFSDGKKEIIVPTFVRYLEVLQGTLHLNLLFFLF